MTVVRHFVRTKESQAIMFVKAFWWMTKEISVRCEQTGNRLWLIGWPNYRDWWLPLTARITATIIILLNLLSCFTCSNYFHFSETLMLFLGRTFFDSRSSMMSVFFIFTIHGVLKIFLQPSNLKKKSSSVFLFLFLVSYSYSQCPVAFVIISAISLLFRVHPIISDT